MFGRSTDDETPQPDTDLAGVEPTEATTTDTSHENTVVTPSSAGSDAWQHPGQPLDHGVTEPPKPTEPLTPVHNDISSISSAPSILSDKADTDETKVTDNPPAVHHDVPDIADISSNDLIDIKQKALGQLSPLMSHLDQTPEEKFRTTMMMIQASDDQTLVKEAYEAAQKITDEKTRAQALLDIVNEINYFTQHQPGA